MPPTAPQARAWLQKWRWYERNSLPWNRARIHWEFMRRDAFVRWPVHGNVLEALRDGRLELGPGTLFEPNVWITAPGEALVCIDPGMAFGTGQHPTTALCLERVDELLARRPGADLLDVGTGSGVIALLAKKLGARRVVGTENDPLALRIAAGAPAKALRKVTYGQQPGRSPLGGRSP